MPDSLPSTPLWQALRFYIMHLFDSLSYVGQNLELEVGPILLFFVVQVRLESQWSLKYACIYGWFGASNTWGTITLTYQRLHIFRTRPG